MDPGGQRSVPPDGEMPVKRCLASCPSLHTCFPQFACGLYTGASHPDPAQSLSAKYTHQEKGDMPEAQGWGLGRKTKQKVQVEERKDRHPPLVQKPGALCSSQVTLWGRKGVASGDSCSCRKQAHIWVVQWYWAVVPSVRGKATLLT